MKLMGISKLAELASCRRRSRRGDTGPCRRAGVEGAWQSTAEMADFFAAVVDGMKATIPLAAGYRVELLADCKAQMILIDYAGSETGARADKRRSKAA